LRQDYGHDTVAGAVAEAVAEPALVEDCVPFTASHICLFAVDVAAKTAGGTSEPNE
jgi:hypothetical protein